MVKRMIQKWEKYMECKIINADKVAKTRLDGQLEIDLVKCYVKWTDRETYEYIKLTMDQMAKRCQRTAQSLRAVVAVIVVEVVHHGGGSKKIIDARMF